MANPYINADYFPEDKIFDPVIPHLYLVRGLPGAGKTTFASTMLPASFTDIWEADQFFVCEGKYLYDGRLIKAAHDWCYANVVRSLRAGRDVAVCNTFTTIREMQRYLEIPDLIGPCTISIIEMQTKYTNVHGVPEDVMRKMEGRWEDIPDRILLDGNVTVHVIDANTKVGGELEF